MRADPCATMSTNQTLILLEISPSRQQLTVCKHGKVVAQRLERLDPPSATSGVPPQRRWAEQLTAFQATLSSWVHELNLSGRPVSIVYTGPDSAASVYSVPAVTGAGAARAAAELALGEAAAFPLDAAAHDIVLLRTDAAPGVNADGSPRPAQMHHLAAIDSDFSASLVCQCAENAGLKVQRCAPGPAMMLAAAWAIANRHAADTGACAVLWLGEQGSALVASSKQRLAFARYLPHGCEHLVEALMRSAAGRAATSGAPGAAASERAALREALLKYGVPENANAASSTSSAMPVSLPLIRPVLQRLAIEFKQSMRFGLSSEERGELKVLLAGPGAVIPYLSAVLTTDTGVQVSHEHETPGSAAAEASAIDGESSAFVAAQEIAINVLPRSRREMARYTTLRRGLRVGIALAIVASVADAGQNYIAAQNEQEVVAKLEKEQNAPSPAREALAKAAAARVGVTQAKARLKQLVPDAPSPAAVLVLLGEEAPDSIRLRNIELAPDRGGWAVRISGIVTLDPEQPAPPADTLKAFLDRLAGSPLVTSATLGATHMSAAAEVSQLSFDASVMLVGLPFDELHRTFSPGVASVSPLTPPPPTAPTSPALNTLITSPTPARADAETTGGRP